MLKSVLIENFQSHKHTIMKFVPGTNVIIGESDTGKSAAFRAINWVCSNRPLGNAFRSEWGGDTKVTIFTSEGNVIQRLKTKSKNDYIVNNKTLSAFGSEVPAEVKNILQMDFANIQAQMDSPFLLSSTPGEAAKLLNKAASIDGIDHTISNLKRSYGRIDGNIKHNKTQLLSSIDDVKQYKNIPILEKKYKKLKENYDFCQEEIGKQNHLSAIIFDIKNVQYSLNNTKYVDENIETLKNLNGEFRSLNTNKEDTKNLRILIWQIIKTQEKIEKLKGIDDKILTIKSLEKSIKTFKEKKEKTKKLREINSRIAQINRTINTIKTTTNSLEKQFKNLAPEICPLCGNIMKSEKSHPSSSSCAPEC